MRWAIQLVGTLRLTASDVLAIATKLGKYPIYGNLMGEAYMSQIGCKV